MFGSKRLKVLPLLTVFTVEDNIARFWQIHDVAYRCVICNCVCIVIIFMLNITIVTYRCAVATLFAIICYKIMLITMYGPCSCT